MESSTVSRVRFLFPLAMLMLAAQCGGDTDEAPATETSAGQNAAPAAAGNVPDACGFIPRSELEELVGWELREGEPDDVAPGSYACDFSTPPEMYVTRTFPDPPLPQSVGFSSVKIATFPADPETFAMNRQIVGPQGEEPAGVGDAAFYNGLDMLYVRAGNRGFSVRLYTNAQTDADRARVRDVMMTLGRRGANGLR
jgi:hypothetical protein